MLVESLKNRAPVKAEQEHTLESGFAHNRAGQRLYYEINRSAADGPDLVIVNNFFMTAQQWRPFVGKLRGQASVLCYDLRGQGRSEPSSEVVTVEEHARDLGDLLKALRKDAVVLVGTCISCVIAARFALESPGALRGLVLVGSVINPYGPMLHSLLHRSLLNSLRLGGPETLFDHYYPLLYTAQSVQSTSTPGYLVAKNRFVRNNPQRQLELNLESSARLDFPPERLREIATPTLLLAGEDDFLTRPGASATLARSMPRATTVTVPNAGHNVYIEVPNAFQAELLAFTESLEKVK